VGPLLDAAVPVGDLLLLAAFAVAGAALANAVLHAAARSPAAERRAVLLGWTAAALTALAFLALVGHFVARDYSVFTVWNYTDDETPLYLRIAGSWAGSAGSVFLWTVLLGCVLAAEELWLRRARAAAREGPSDTAGVVRVAMLAILVTFLFLTLTARPFAPTADYHLDGAVGFFTYQPGLRDLPDPLDYRASGFGLNPLLVTPFMAIHPPFEFAAYAAAAMPFAFAIGWLVTRDPRWWGGALAWARVAWLCYAIALGLGALWAYYVLSFGGYWAWDPVEVGDLVPFLALTTFLHAVDSHRKTKGWAHYTPLLAALVFPLTLFGTFVTRSSYWISAHAFDVGSAGIVLDPAQRLLATLGAKPQVAAFVALLLALLAAMAVLLLVRFARDARAHRKSLAAPAVAFAALYGLAMVAAAGDVGGMLRGGFGLAGAIGGGNLLLGLAVLGLLFVGGPVALILLRIEDDAEPARVDPEALLQPDALMSLGVVLMSLGLLVTVAVLLIGVNFTVGQLAETFKEREPLVVLPLALVLTMRLTVKTVGGRRAAAIAFTALAAGLLLYLALPSDLKLLGIGVPVMGVALGAALQQLVRAAAKGSPAPKGARTAGALLLLAAMAGFAMWASPPSTLLGAPVPLALVPLGLGAAMGAYVMGIAVLQGEGRVSLWLGVVLATASGGYGLGIVLGIGALLAGRRHATMGHSVRETLRRVRGRVYGTSRWAAHVAILLVFIGYGASAYHATEADFHDLRDPLVRGVPRAFGDATLTLTDSRGVDRDGDGAFEEVTALIRVEQGGRLLDVAPLTLYWVEKEGQYRPTEHVVRQPLEDIYLNSNPANLPSFHTATDGWVGSNQGARFDLQGGQPKFRSDAVDMLSLSVKRLPMVAPLWAGAALLPFSMALTIASAPPRGFAKAEKGPKEGASPAPGDRGAVARE
jgi:cytochrome c biogenesis factor